MREEEECAHRKPPTATSPASCRYQGEGLLVPRRRASDLPLLPALPSHTIPWHYTVIWALHVGGCRYYVVGTSTRPSFSKASHFDGSCPGHGHTLLYRGCSARGLIDLPNWCPWYRGFGDGWHQAAFLPSIGSVAPGGAYFTSPPGPIYRYKHVYVILHKIMTPYGAAHTADFFCIKQKRMKSAWK